MHGSGMAWHRLLLRRKWRFRIGRHALPPCRVVLGGSCAL